MRIIGRSVWGARGRLFAAMQLPVMQLFLHHSVTQVTSDPYADMRKIEDVGLERFGRFSYNWAIHPDGTIMEGAGRTIGAHTGGHNSSSVSIVLIGNYETRTVTPAQRASLEWLIRELRSTGVLTPTHRIDPHSAVRATACPGAHVFRLIPGLRLLETIVSPPQETLDMNEQQLRQILREEWAAYNQPVILKASDSHHHYLVYVDDGLAIYINDPAALDRFAKKYKIVEPEPHAAIRDRFHIVKQ